MVSPTISMVAPCFLRFRLNRLDSSTRAKFRLCTLLRTLDFTLQ
jgi:hypothetical protein